MFRAVLSATAAIFVVLPGSAAAATRYLSPSGNDSAACTASAPCKTFDRGYRVAAAGDTVEMAGGSYGGQSIPAVAGRAAPAVQFRPATGATVTLGDLSIRGSHVTVSGVRPSYVNVDAGSTQATGVTLANVITGGMWINNVRDLKVQGGSIGPRNNDATVKIGSGPSSVNITFDGVDFHDATATDSQVHTECVWAGDVQGLTIRNSMFRNCAYFGLFVTHLAGTPPKNHVIENNVFETTKQWNGQAAPYSMMVAEHVKTMDTFTFRNNTFESEVALGSASVVNTKMVGNIGIAATCKGGVTYSYNVWTQRTCGSTDRQASNVKSFFQDPAAHDWRLKAGSPAIDRGNPSDFPATDRAGATRNGLPDAGAYEYAGGTPTTPPPSSGDTKPPSVPQGMAWTTTTKTSLGLRWNAATDNVGVTGYRLYRNGTLAGTTTGTSYTVSGLTCNTSYTIGLTAVDAAGNESYRPEAVGTTRTSAC